MAKPAGQRQQTSLRRAFTVWIQRVILADSEADTATEQIIELDEVRTMLAQRVQQWKQQWREGGFAEGLKQGREQGLEQGLEQGVTKGLIQGERLLLIRQSRLRFDTTTANALAPLLDRVSDPELLAQIGEWMIQAASGEELLARVTGLLDAH